MGALRKRRKQDLLKELRPYGLTTVDIANLLCLNADFSPFPGCNGPSLADPKGRPSRDKVDQRIQHVIAAYARQNREDDHMLLNNVIRYLKKDFRHGWSVLASMVSKTKRDMPSWRCCTAPEKDKVSWRCCDSVEAADTTPHSEMSMPVTITSVDRAAIPLESPSISSPVRRSRTKIACQTRSTAGASNPAAGPSTNPEAIDAESLVTRQQLLSIAGQEKDPGGLPIVHLRQRVVRAEIATLKRKLRELQDEDQVLSSSYPHRCDVEARFQAPVDSGFNLDSPCPCAQSSNDAPAAKRLHQEDVPSPPPADLVRFPTAAISFTWSVSGVDKQVQSSERNRPQNVRRKYTKLEFLKQVPNDEQKWDSLRTISNLKTSERLLDTFQALIIRNKSNASELIKAYHERKDMARHPLLRCYEELIFYCICVISMYEGSSSEEVNRSMQAYSDRARKPSSWARLRTTVKSMACLMDDLEGKVGCQGSQLFLMNSLPIDKYRQITESADIEGDFTTKIAANLESVGAEADNYRLSFSLAVLIAFMGIKLEIVNKALGTNLTPERYMSECTNFETLLKACSTSKDERRLALHALSNSARSDDDFPWDDYDELSMQPRVDPAYKDCFLDVSMASCVAEMAERTFVSEPRKSPLQPLFRLDENGTLVKRDTMEFERLDEQIQVQLTALPKELESPVLDNVLEKLGPRIWKYTQQDAYDYEVMLVELGAGLFRARDEALCSILIPIEVNQTDHSQRMRFDKGQKDTDFALVEWPSLVILPAGCRVRKVGSTIIFIFVTILPKGTLETEKESHGSASQHG